jgi:heat shock protein HslJ
MRTLLVGLVLLTVACRRPSTQFSAMLTPVNQPDDYTRYLKAGDELVAVGSDPAWSLTVNPSQGVLLFKPQHGDSSIVSLSENQISRTADSTNGAFGYQSLDGRIKVLFRPDSCTDKLSGQRYDYHVDVVSQGKNVVGCGVSLRQLALLHASWVLTGMQGDSLATNGPEKTIPRLEISLIQGRVTGTTGCNQLNGPVRADTHQILFGPLITTKMACMDPDGTVETKFLPLLNQPMTYRINSRELTLFRQGKPVLTFKKVD